MRTKIKATVVRKRVKARLDGSIVSEAIDSAVEFLNRANKGVAAENEGEVKVNLAAAAQHVGTAFNGAGFGKYGGPIQKIAKKAYTEAKR